LAEQQKAIESLIPGSLYHYHLYFIHLSKQKDFDELSAEDKELYAKFEEKFVKTPEFLEVETAFHVIRKLEKLPKKADDDAMNDEKVKELLEIVDYIDNQINENYEPTRGSIPDYMRNEGHDEGEDACPSYGSE
jgi:hypothetical protein